MWHSSPTPVSQMTLFTFCQRHHVSCDNALGHYCVTMPGNTLLWLANSYWMGYNTEPILFLDNNPACSKLSYSYSLELFWPYLVTFPFKLEFSISPQNQCSKCLVSSIQHCLVKQTCFLLAVWQVWPLDLPPSSLQVSAVQFLCCVGEEAFSDSVTLFSLFLAATLTEAALAY